MKANYVVVVRERMSFWAAFWVFAVLMVIVHYWMWIAAVTAAVVIGVYIHRSAQRSAQRKAELAARADQQHQWTLAGDERGTYGES